MLSRRTICIPAAVLAAGFWILCWAPGVVFARNNAAAVRYVEGESGILRSGASNWAAVTLNDVIFTGDTLRTGTGSKLIIVFDDGTVVNLGSLTVMQVQKATLDAQGIRRTDLELKNGSVRANVESLLRNGSSFQISTPSAVAGVRGTDFMVILEDDQSTRVAVFLGEVEVEAVGRRMREIVKVEAGRALKLFMDKPPEAPVQMDGRTLNQLRDRVKEEKAPKTPDGRPILRSDKEDARILALGVSGGLDPSDARVMVKMIEDGKLGRPDAEKMARAVGAGVPVEDINTLIGKVKTGEINRDELRMELVRINPVGESVAVPEGAPELVYQKNQVPVPAIPPHAVELINTLKSSDLPPVVIDAIHQAVMDNAVDPEMAAAMVKAINLGADPRMMMELVDKAREQSRTAAPPQPPRETIEPPRPVEQKPQPPAPEPMPEPKPEPKPEPQKPPVEITPQQPKPTPEKPEQVQPPASEPPGQEGPRIEIEPVPPKEPPPEVKPGESEISPPREPAPAPTPPQGLQIDSEIEKPPLPPVAPEALDKIQEQKRNEQELVDIAKGLNIPVEKVYFLIKELDRFDVPNAQDLVRKVLHDMALGVDAANREEALQRILWALKNIKTRQEFLDFLKKQGIVGPEAGKPPSSLVDVEPTTPKP